MSAQGTEPARKVRRVRKSTIDPIKALNLIAHYGNIDQVSELMGYHPRTLLNVSCRPHQWRLKFAIECGLYIYRSNRAKVLRGEGQSVVGPATRRPSTARRADG